VELGCDSVWNWICYVKPTGERTYIMNIVYLLHVSTNHVVIREVCYKGWMMVRDFTTVCEPAADIKY
jgi:hypothetical protein